MAIAGKVFCRVDADYGSIEMGDLLTTSATAGYAMKAEDPNKSFGTVLGKALGSCDSGKDLIPIIACLR